MSAVYIALHCRPLQCRWLFNGSGSLFSLVCPFEGAAHVSASLRAGLLFRSLLCLSPMCAALVFFAVIYLAFPFPAIPLMS